MPVYANITIDQGSSFTTTFDVVDSNGAPFDLSLWSVRSQLRKTYTSSTTYAFNAGVVIPATNGQITISMSPLLTAAIKAGRYVYDIEIVGPGGAVKRVIEGQAEVTPRVTTEITIEDYPLGDLGDLSDYETDAFGVPISSSVIVLDLMDPAGELIYEDLGTVS